MSVTSEDKDLCTFTFTFNPSELRRGGKSGRCRGKKTFAPKHGMRVRTETDVRLEMFECRRYRAIASNGNASGLC